MPAATATSRIGAAQRLVALVEALNGVQDAQLVTLEDGEDFQLSADDPRGLAADDHEAGGVHASTSSIVNQSVGRQI